MEYFKRISDVHLRERLEALGAVLIEGPKWCGKTTTAEQQAKSIIRFQDPDEREELQTRKQKIIFRRNGIMAGMENKMPRTMES